MNSNQCEINQVDNIIDGCREIVFNGSLDGEDSRKLFESLEKLREISVGALKKEAVFKSELEFYLLKYKKNGFAIDLDSSHEPELGMYSMLPFFDNINNDG